MCRKNYQIVCYGSKTVHNDRVGGEMQVPYSGWAKVPVSM